MCFERDGHDDVPGCIGSGGKSDWDYCVYPSLEDVDPDPTFKLDVCEGDCDGDDDCKGDLVCFQRDGYREVPGCLGKGDDGWDYCIEDH